MTKAERAQWWHDHPDAVSATKSLPSVDCSPLGISSLIGVTSKSAISIWSLPTIDSYASNDDASSSGEDDDSSLDRECYPWDDWDALVQELDTSNDACVAGSSAAPAIPRMPSMAITHRCTEKRLVFLYVLTICAWHARLARPRLIGLQQLKQR